VHLHANSINLDAFLFHGSCHVSDVLGFGAVIVGDRETVVVIKEEYVGVSLCCGYERLVNVVSHLGVPRDRRLQEGALLSIPVDRLVDHVPTNDRRGSYALLDALHDVGNVSGHDLMELIVVEVSVGEPVWVAISPD